MKAVNDYVIVDIIKEGPKKVGGFILTDETDETDNNLSTLTEDDKICPEGYVFKNKGCVKACKSCKLGKCKYGICGLQ